MMLSTDTWMVLSILWAVRNGRSRSDLLIDRGRALGYFAALSAHNHITYEQRERLDSLLVSAAHYAGNVVYDLECQGWSDDPLYRQQVAS